MSALDPTDAVVATARAMASEGLVSGSEGNVSVRLGERVLITPRALPYGDMSGTDVVTLDLTGKAVAGDREPSSERRVHLAIYAARPDVGAVVHTHSPAATRWSALGRTLTAGGEGRKDVETARRAPAGSDELAHAVVEALGAREAALMTDHGVVAVGPDLVRALDVAREVERRARLASRENRAG